MNSLFKPGSAIGLKRIAKMKKALIAILNAVGCGGRRGLPTPIIIEHL